MSQNTTTTPAPSLQDFSLIRTYVEKFQSENGLLTASFGFCFFILDLILNLQIDEIEDSLTDSSYLQSTSQDSGHDRGLDAVYIDGAESPSTVHIFSFKYTEDFEHSNRFFPANEIDKILGFLASLMQRDESLREHVNPVLFSKAQEIWTLFQSENPKFVIHICSNYYQSFEKHEKVRFERELAKYTFITAEYHVMSSLVEKLTHKGRQIVNGRVKAVDKNLFEKSGGDIRALVVELDARDLIRLVVGDEALRDRVDLDDYSVLQGQQLLEDAFEDNVRIYLRQRSRINRNIKTTALGDESHRFFFYNNGITLTCSHFQYPRGQRGPIIQLDNIQVVNGGQTIHALFEAFQENPEKFEEMEILCRIYQTTSQSVSTSIAEYTNSQNPVNSRDIRSNDYVQKKLERELLAKDFYYERKKGQYQDKPRNKRIDAEKAGQVLMTFFNGLPAEAKDNKRLIFADKYDEVFSDSVTAESLLLPFFLFVEIENERKRAWKKIVEDPTLYSEDSFILHASYYLLYFLKKLAELREISLELSNLAQIFGLYAEAMRLVRRTVQLEIMDLQKRKEPYSPRVFFKGNRPKKHLDTLLPLWPNWESNSE
jgi:hypothetical protein